MFCLMSLLKHQYWSGVAAEEHEIIGFTETSTLFADFSIYLGRFSYVIDLTLQKCLMTEFSKLSENVR